MSFDFGLQTVDLFVFDEHEIIDWLVPIGCKSCCKFIPKCFVSCCTKIMY